MLRRLYLISWDLVFLFLQTRDPKRIWWTTQVSGQMQLFKLNAILSSTNGLRTVELGISIPLLCWTDLLFVQNQMVCKLILSFPLMFILKEVVLWLRSNLLLIASEWLGIELPHIVWEGTWKLVVYMLVSIK